MPPTSRTHRGAPSQDHRIAGDGADGDAIKGGTGAKAEVDIRASIIFDARRIRRDRDEGQGPGTIREQASLIVLWCIRELYPRIWTCYVAKSRCALARDGQLIGKSL
jgi:hypothetical protein